MRTFILFLYIVAGVTGQGFSTTFLQNTLFGGDHSDFGVSSWSDQARGVRYVIGQTYSSKFSGASATGALSAGAPDILLVKLDQATDSLLWNTVVGTSRSDQPRDITGDSEGNIWITGQTFGSFDNSDNTGSARGFAMKLDSNGKTLVTKYFDNFQPTAIESDSNGRLWIVGSITAETDDDNSNEDVAVVVLSATGEQLSFQTFGGSASDIAKTIAVSQNSVAIGGVTYSSDFPVTKGSRECEFCSGAGFVMTLTFDKKGVKQSFSTYIIGTESQSLSVVDIALDTQNNMYLSIVDDSNSMGAYVQQLKSDKTYGWRSEKSDAFWKVEYLPLIDSVYTIGSFSTPTDYAIFYVLDAKTGSSVYTSKALTGALVEASVYVVDQSTVKISMVGTLQKDLRISQHGRTYTTTHKSDDILIVSLTIKSLSKVANTKITQANATTSFIARDQNTADVCLVDRSTGFFPFGDFIQDTFNLRPYSLLVDTASAILPFEPTNDYDSPAEHGPLVTWDFANGGRPARLINGIWGRTFELYFQFVLPRLEIGQSTPIGKSYIVLDVPSVGAAQIVITNSGRAPNTDLVSWKVQVSIPALGAEVSQTIEVTLGPKIRAPLSIWVSYNGDATQNHFQVFISRKGLHAHKPAATPFAFTFTAARVADWASQARFYPKITSGSQIETLIRRVRMCGFVLSSAKRSSDVINQVPVSYHNSVPVTGQTSYPPDTTPWGLGQSWVGQVWIPTIDSIPGTQTKIQFLKADGNSFQNGFTQLFIYRQPFSLSPLVMRKRYDSNFHASIGITGLGSLAGYVFGRNVNFTAGTTYYLYFADGMTEQDNMLLSDSASFAAEKRSDLSVSQKRDDYGFDDDTDDTNEETAPTFLPMLTYNSQLEQYEESTTKTLIFSVTSKPPAGSDPLAAEDPAYPPGTPRVDADSSDICDPSVEACIREDPVFIGYNNQKYVFDGKAGSMYNLYNDPWVNVNSLFGYANEKKKTGTVLHTIGISIGEHNLLFDITNRENRRFFDVIIDGVTTRVGYNSQHLSGCVDLQYNTKVLLVTTPRHSIRMSIEWGHNWHINVPYFDLAIHHPEEDVSKIGGLLGQTAHEGSKRGDVDVIEDDFTVSSIFSFEKSKFYNLNSIDC